MLLAVRCDSIPALQPSKPSPLQPSIPPTLHASNSPTLQPRNPTLQTSTSPTLQRSSPPALKRALWCPLLGVCFKLQLFHDLMPGSLRIILRGSGLPGNNRQGNLCGGAEEHVCCSLLASRTLGHSRGLDSGLFNVFCLLVIASLAWSSGEFFDIVGDKLAASLAPNVPFEFH